MSDFDFDAFISGTQLARRTVTVYRVDHRDEIARLQAQHDATPAGDDREGTKGDRRALAERVAALRQEMEDSVQAFVIRTLTPAEFKRVTDDDDFGVADQLAMQSVEPALTAEQWARLGDVIGHRQWVELVAQANDLVLSKVAVPDFSQSVSETLSPPTS